MTVALYQLELQPIDNCGDRQWRPPQ